jgi:hypothetical protein
MDNNKSRRKKSLKWAKNKEAFNEILGDPFAPEPIDGVYNLLHYSSTISSIEGTFGEAPGTIYAEKPSILDFFCDVDMAISKIITNDTFKAKFYNTYIYMCDDEWPWGLDKTLRPKFEQLIGNEFLRRGISPVKRYFTITKLRGR